MSQLYGFHFLQHSELPVCDAVFDGLLPSERIVIMLILLWIGSIHSEGTQPKFDTCLIGDKDLLRNREDFATEDILQIIQKRKVWFLEFWRTWAIVIVSVTVQLAHRIYWLHSLGF